MVAHQTPDREVPSSIPSENWAFFSSLSYLSISGASSIRSLVEVQHCLFSNFQKEKMEGLAEELEVKQA